MNEVLKCINTRRSVKSYKPDMPKKEDINAVIEAGIAAASGRNKQSPIVVAITNKELRDELAAANASVLGMTSDPFYGAPVILVVLAKKSVNTYLYDGSLVMGNLMNAAYAVGVDSCWIHRAREEFESEEGKALLREWGVENAENYVGIGHCILGYRDCEYPAPIPRKENYIYKV